MSTRQALDKLVDDLRDKGTRRNLDDTPALRRLSEGDIGGAATSDLALISIDAPAGGARLVLGGEQADDNVILHKDHASDGAAFTLSRNATRAMRVDLAGKVEMGQDPFTIRSTLASSSGEPLVLSGAGEGVSLQNSKVIEVSEVDGATSWSRGSLLIFTGDTVRWSWINYHNLVEVSASGTLTGGGITSGEPSLSSTFSYTFTQPGTYYFKSQAADTMRMNVEVREFAVRNGTLTAGGDVSVGGDLLVAGHEHEVKLFLGTACPPNWVEAEETKGYFLMSNPTHGQAGRRENRPMDFNERGRTHGATYRKTDQRYHFTTSSTSYYESAPPPFNSATMDYPPPPSPSPPPPGGNAINVLPPAPPEYHDESLEFPMWDFRAHVGSTMYYFYDKLRNKHYQTPEYMAPLGEYYPFISILVCKRAGVTFPIDYQCTNDLNTFADGDHPPVLTPATMADCKAACSANRLCVAFVHNTVDHGNCYVKTGLITGTSADLPEHGTTSCVPAGLG